MTKRLLLNYRALILVSVAFAATIACAADFNVRDYGAKPDGSKCTEAFAAAFAAAEKAGGGRVIVLEGKWFSGAIRFRSNCELHLEEGAEVLFSQDPEDYLPAVFTSWEGMECWNYCPLVYAYGCTNVAITGKGTLRAYEGRWEDTKWYPWVWQENGIKAARLQLYTWGATDYPVEKREIWKMPNAHTRPHFIQFNRCRNVRLEDFKVRNSPFWTIHLYQCEDASVRGLDVYAHGNNNDGIDIEMSKNVLVEKCVFDQGDDGVVIKSGRNRDAWRIGKPTENVLVRDCEIRNGHSMFGIGSEISGGVRNVTLKDCTAGDVSRIFFLKTNRRRGGFLENITCENVTARSARISVFGIATDVLYEWADFPDYENRTTRISGITARNILVDSTKDVVRLCGDSSLPPKNIRWENVTAKKFTGKELVLNNVAVASTASGEIVFVQDREVFVHKDNYDKSKIAPYTLEDPLTFADGRKVKSAADWCERRREILGIFAREMYGEEPPRPETLITELTDEKPAVDGMAIRRQYRMRFKEDGSGPSINWIVWIPKFVKKPVPVISFLNFNGNHELVPDEDVPVQQGWMCNNANLGITNHSATAATRGRLQDPNGATVFPLGMILARGYAVMSACYCEVSPDPNRRESDSRFWQNPFAYTGVFELWGERDQSRTDNITSLGAWAWALSRGLDLAERIPELDAKRAVVTGCSRLGKAALIAAARDERFAVCVPNQTGGGGVPLAKRDYGENVSTENRYFTHWFCRAYAKHSEAPWKTLSFDQHLLVACIAPRALLVEGFDSPWFDAEGEYLSVRAASPVWEFLGMGGMPDVPFPDDFDTSAIGRRLGYVRRSQNHGISACDWTWLLDFADRQLRCE